MNNKKYFEMLRKMPPETKAREFIRHLFGGGPCCEGAEQLAVQCGVLEQVVPIEPCSDDGSCYCEEHGFHDGLICNRVIV